MKFASNTFKKNLVPKMTPEQLVKTGFTQQVQATVDPARSLMLDSVLVRIMKSRKVMAYNLLVGQTLSDVKLFRPEMKMIKRRIEDLTERGFMERDLETKEMVYIP